MAASNYAACLKQILKYEGGYVNNPRDPGGETNFGVTKRTAQSHGYGGDMHHIPMSFVERIYATSFWNTPYYRGDDLAPGVDLATFDFGVNSGPSRAGAHLKKAQGGSAKDTVKKLCASRLSFMHGLRTWSTFGSGWARRVASVEAIGIRMALAASGMSAPEVHKELKKEATAAKNLRNAAGAGSAGSIAPSPSFDWTTKMGFALLLIALVVGGYFVYRAYLNHTRAVALDGAAGDLGNGKVESPVAAPVAAGAVVGGAA